MKRIRIILSVAIILATLTGCGTKKVQNNDSQINNIPSETITDKDSSDTNIANSDSKNKDNNAKKDNTSTNSNKVEETNNGSTNSNKEEKNANASSSSTIDDNNKEQKSFYGNWQIKKIAGYANVTAGGDESIIGTKITVSKDLATLGDESFNIPKYEVINRSKDEMTSDLKTNLSNIGIDANSITEIEVLDEINKRTMILFIKDEKTLLYLGEGNVYYEAIRV